MILYLTDFCQGIKVTFGEESAIIGFHNGLIPARAHLALAKIFLYFNMLRATMLSL